MKRNDYYAFAINGILFLIGGGVLGGVALANSVWVLLIIATIFATIGTICVMAIAESAREKRYPRT